MRRASAGLWLTAGALVSSPLMIAAATAQTAGSEDLVKMQANSANVVMPTITYDNQRYSKLNQITAQNVGKLQVAWTFSTGVLRGHEGAPLVIGDVMYVHAPFPNTVFALDLNNDGKILWKYEPKQDPNVIPVMCCDTVNRGLAYADGKLFLHQADTTLGGARCEDRQGGLVGEDRRSRQRRDRHRCTDGRQGQGVCRRVRRRVRRAWLGRRPIRWRTASRSGAPIPRGRTATCWWIRRRPRCWASRSAPTSA